MELARESAAVIVDVLLCENRGIRGIVVAGLTLWERQTSWQARMRADVPFGNLLARSSSNTTYAPRKSVLVG